MSVYQRVPCLAGAGRCCERAACRQRRDSFCVHVRLRLLGLVVIIRSEPFSFPLPSVSLSRGW